MKTLESIGPVPEGITSPDDDSFRTKLVDFAGATAAGIHFVFDFDRTLTVRSPDTQEDITTWNILREHLPTDAQPVYKQLFDKYRALEIDGTMTEADAAEWWTSTLDLFVASKLNLREVEKDFLERASIRSGTADLFKLCKDNRVPTVIMSAGVRDVIEIWDKVYDIAPSLVISTALDIDEIGQIVGWHRETLVHVLNKAETSHPELASIRELRPKAIVVGDGMGDADMASGDANVLRVRIFDPRPDEAVDIALEREKTFARFDAMIENGSLAPLVELTRMIIG